MILEQWCPYMRRESRHFLFLIHLNRVAVNVKCKAILFLDESIEGCSLIYRCQEKDIYLKYPLSTL